MIDFGLINAAADPENSVSTEQKGVPIIYYKKRNSFQTNNPK